MRHVEAVRLAKEKLGRATPGELAAYIKDAFGLEIKPAIVAVLLGTLKERAALDQSGQAAYAKIDQWKADNPEQAKKMAAVTKRREAARRKKAGRAAANVAGIRAPHRRNEEGAVEAKETVRTRHPAAEACRREVPVGGSQARVWFWFVFPGDGDGQAFLGLGRTEAEAWRRAAAVVIARSRAG